MELQKGVYQHYKGKYYEVLHLAHHAESEELMVVYKTLYDKEGIWVRPYEMFIEDVSLKGKTVKRFMFVGKG